MNRSNRRKYEKEFKRLLKMASDNCTICGKPFEHNKKTFGGLTSSKATVLTGECCVSHIEEIINQGVFLTSNYAQLVRANTSNELFGKSNPTLSAQDLTKSVESLQSHIAGFDKLTNDVAKRGGLKKSAHAIHTADSPWKTNDAEWFKKHSNRSHRLRAMHQEEALALSKDVANLALPDNHVWEILVRQVEAGKRIRTIFCRNTEIEIHDVEEVIHALFDIVLEAKGRVITIEEVATLAKIYQTSLSSKPS